jgi:molybdopterin-guanine dinucleotide biosynthesis protein B
MQVFGITGWKNSGKTTLVEGVVRELVRCGLKVATVKHAHHDFDIDQPGKDSHRHRLAGAGEVIVASAKRWALIHELRDAPEPGLAALLAKLSPCDLVIVEGFKREPHPKLEVIGPQPADAPRYLNDPTIVALAGVERPDSTLPYFDRDDVAGIAGFILMYMGLTFDNAL